MRLANRGGAWIVQKTVRVDRTLRGGHSPRDSLKQTAEKIRGGTSVRTPGLRARARAQRSRTDHEQNNHGCGRSLKRREVRPTGRVLLQAWTG